MSATILFLGKSTSVSKIEPCELFRSKTNICYSVSKTEPCELMCLLQFCSGEKKSTSAQALWASCLVQLQTVPRQSLSQENELTDVLRCKCSALLQIMELRKPSRFTQRGKFCFYEQQYIGLWALRVRTETIQL